MRSRSILRNYQGVFLIGIKMLDVTFVVVGAAAAHVSAGPGPPASGAWKAVVLMALLLFTFMANAARLYQPWRGQRLRHEVSLLIVLISLTIGGIVLAVEFLSLLPAGLHNAKLYGYWWLSALVLVIVLRLLLRPGLMLLRRYGINQRRVAIVGMCPATDTYVTELLQHPEFGFLFEGYVDDRGAARDGNGFTLPCLGATDELADLVARHGIDQVWLACSAMASHRTAHVLEALRHQPVVLRQIIDLDSLPQHAGSITSILNRPVLDIDVTMTDGVLGNFAKSVQDKVLATIFLLGLSPLMLCIAIAVKLSSPGPVFYRQTRLTWRNKPFETIKFRTMPVDVEKESGPRWARRGDGRATRVGAFLRAASLDELPQLWNVMRGDMSIVGPRPERPEFIERFKDQIPNYMKKHRVRAGITGWAQVNGYRGDTDLNKRIEYDLHYIRNSSLLFDLYIILLTVVKGCLHKNAY
jgi:putative colanic acid biosysnthesis UDP-glucose lipid carrier transferase